MSNPVNVAILWILQNEAVRRNEFRGVAALNSLSIIGCPRAIFYCVKSLKLYDHHKKNLKINALLRCAAGIIIFIKKHVLIFKILDILKTVYVNIIMIFWSFIMIFLTFDTLGHTTQQQVY